MQPDLSLSLPSTGVLHVYLEPDTSLWKWFVRYHIAEDIDIMPDEIDKYVEAFQHNYDSYTSYLSENGVNSPLYIRGEQNMLIQLDGKAKGVTLGNELLGPPGSLRFTSSFFPIDSEEKLRTIISDLKGAELLARRQISRYLRGDFASYTSTSLLQSEQAAEEEKRPHRRPFPLGTWFLIIISSFFIYIVFCILISRLFPQWFIVW